MTDRTHPDSGRITNPGAAYAALPEPHFGKGRYLGLANDADAYSVAQVSALFASHGQAPAPTHFCDEAHVAIPQMLLGAACSAIDKKRDGTKVLAELRRYTTGDLSRAIAPAPAAVAGPSDDLVTRESAMQAIEHLAISNSPGREDDAIAMLAAAPTAQPAPAVDWSQVGVLMEAHATTRQFLVGTTNWAAAICRYMTKHAAMATGAPQPGAAYAALTRAQCGKVVDAVVEKAIELKTTNDNITIVYDPAAMAAAIGDALRAAHGQAPAQAAPDVSGYVSEWAGGICTADEAMAGIAKLYGAAQEGK